ncbi:hypothetical protein OI9_03787 [Enterococcus faecium EnGen0001]|nr:hypothetical protein OI9_03787 [Enterococcus faecium EnGen0001]
MNDFTTEILKTLANKGDLNELFRVHLEKAVNTLLKTELTAFLDYEKYDRIGFNTGNSRNGSYDVRSRPSTGNFISRFRATATASSSNRLFLLIAGRMIP